MSAPCFIAWAADTSAATGPPATVASAAVAGTAKTILQLKANANQGFRIVEWGYTLDTPPASPLRVELVDTALINATVTTLGSGIRPYNNPAAATNLQVGTAASGFNASAEGTIVASKLHGYQYENGIYFKQQFPLGREPEVGAGNVLRVRVTPTAAVAINIMPYIIWEE